ncbi:hypothetical protein HPP92_028726 [Vanilla planifolia]|uniref:Uncharacterized protein n=1 Tax=Vanilla planifolia TaxID=51239 RepID=A0A835P7H9_VANPL|nr:hypothetical protein HPP92_028726 [Vanilla planifolia]
MNPVWSYERQCLGKIEEGWDLDDLTREKTNDPTLHRIDALPSVSLPRLNKNSKNSETGCDPDGEEEGVREKGRDQLGKLYWWRLIFNWLLGISR